MFIHSKLGYSTVNGPGNRAVVWFQGCSLACDNCWNPDTHAPFCGESIRADQLADWIRAQPDITGVTFSGGEPMQQAPALVSLLNILHVRSSQLSLGMYTGYTRKELDEGRYKTYFSNRGEVTTPFMRTALWEKVEALLDFAVMGRYNQLQPIRTTLRASRNQTLELFSDRYSLENFSKDLEVEILVDASCIQITGFPVKGIEL